MIALLKIQEGLAYEGPFADLSWAYRAPFLCGRDVPRALLYKESKNVGYILVYIKDT